MKNTFIISAAMLLTCGSGAFADVNDFGELTLGQNYTMKVFGENKGTFTATEDGVLTYYSDNTDELRPYTSEDYATEITQFNRTGSAGGYSGQHTYDINVTAGTTYYFYNSFPMNASTFYIEMAGEKKVELTGSNPAIGGKYHIMASGGQMSFTFNKPVTFTTATLQIADNNATTIEMRSTSNSLFTDDIKERVWNAMCNGTAQESDSLTVTINGVALQTDGTVKYNGDGVFTARFALDRKPISVVSTENFTTGGDFLSYYTTDNSKGIVSLQFSGKLNLEDATASLRYGNLDKDPEGEYYYELVTPTLSEDGMTMLLNFQGKRRTPEDMLPEAISGTEYDEIALHISGIKDEYGNYAYSSGQGSLGSYDCIYNYKIVTANIAVEFSPASGSDISNQKTIELWIDDEAKLSYDGILFTYSKNDIKDSVLVYDIQKETDPECTSAKILTFSVPQEVLGSDDIVVTLKNLQSVDGYDYSGMLTASYTANATGIENISTPLSTLHSPLYNIAGQRVNYNTSGIVITEGRKIVK